MIISLEVISSLLGKPRAKTQFSQIEKSFYMKTHKTGELTQREIIEAHRIVSSL